MSRASRCRGTVKMLSVLTTDGRGSPSALPTKTSVGSPREVRVTTATTTAPIVSQTAFLVSTTTGLGPTGGGSSAHRLQPCASAPGVWQPPSAASISGSSDNRASWVATMSVDSMSVIASDSM
jgi:hypothetical protein